MRKLLLWSVLPCLLVTVMFSSRLFGQAGDRAIITGLITDSTGAAVPGATITAINQETKIKTVIGSDSAGNFETPPLILGTYTLTVEKEGFKIYDRPGIILTGGMHYRQDVTMELGAVTQTIEVKASSDMINTQTAEVEEHTVSQSYYEDLPSVMGIDIRLAESLLQIQPGYNSHAQNGDAIFRGSQFYSRVNGGQTESTENWFDGAAFGYAEGHQQTQESSLPYEAVKEMTVVENTFSAQYGHTSGGFVQYTTKSGSNTLHGDLYDFLTTSDEDARNFFLPNIIPLTQNDAGFSVGGPIVIPHIYNGHNKTFFFGTLDRMDYRSTVNTGYVNTLPLPTEIGGNFSQLLTDTTSGQLTQVATDALGRPVYQNEIFNPATLRTVNGVNVRDGFGFDPTTGLPLANANIIPTSMYSAVSNKYIALIPPPNRLTVNQNEFGGTSDDNDQIDVTTWLARVDHSFNDKLNMSDTFYMNNRPRIAHCGGPEGCNVQNDPWTGATKNDTYIGQGFDQRVANRFEHLQFDWVIKPNVVNHTTLAYDRWFMGGASLSAGAGWPQILGISGIDAPPGGPPDIGFSSVVPYTNFGTSWEQGFETNNRYQVLDDISWITGKHSVKAGFEYRYMQFPQHGWAESTGGSFNFNSNETSGFDSKGDILGANSGDAFASLLLGQVDNAGYTVPAYYTPIQNYWAPWVNDEIKVTSKLTLSIGLRLDYETALREMHHRESTFDPTLANPAAGGIPGALQFLPSGQNSFEHPTWNVGPRFGIAYRLSSKNVFRGGYGMYYSGVPGALAGGYPVTGYTTNPSAPNLTGGVQPAFDWDNGFPTADIVLPPQTSSTFANGTAVIADAAHTTTMPRYSSWTVSVERQLSSNMSLDVAYVGNHATRLISSPDDLGPGANMNPASVLSYGSTELLTPIGSQTTVPSPYPGFVGDVAQALRPFPQYQEILYRNAYNGQSHYNALQITFDRRLTHGFSLRVGETWSKLINDNAENAEAGFGSAQGQSGIQNPSNFQKGERGLSIDNTPNNLGIGWIYMLPFGQGQLLGKGVGNGVNRLINGWKLSATQVYQSGRPLSITMNNDLSGFLFNDNLRPNKLGGGGSSSYNNNPTNAYLSPSGWADPGPLNFGNASRTDPVIRGFGYYNEDLDLMKDTHINERFWIRFDMQAGNVLNRVDFCPVNTNWSNQTAGGFGYTSSQCNISRRIQFGLTVNF